MDKNNSQAFTVFVKTPAKKFFRFKFLAIEASSEEELLIESTFYTEHDVMPEFPHYEILWCNGGHYNGMLLTDMHLHKSKKEGDYFYSQFLCFTGRIAEKSVKSILLAWCIGTAYRFETGEDMNDAIKRFGGSIDKFISDCQNKGYGGIVH